MMNYEELLDYLIETHGSARRHIRAQQWQEANNLMKPAINELGRKYCFPDVIDDTSWYLCDAIMYEQDGEAKVAAYMRQKVLRYRTYLFRKKVAARLMLRRIDMVLPDTMRLTEKNELKEANTNLVQILKEIEGLFFFLEGKEEVHQQLTLAEAKEKNDELAEAIALRVHALENWRDCLQNLVAQRSRVSRMEPDNELDNEALLVYSAWVIDSVEDYMQDERWQEANELLRPALKHLNRKRSPGGWMDHSDDHLRAADHRESEGFQMGPATTRLLYFKIRYRRLKKRFHLAKTVNNDFEKIEEMVGNKRYEEANLLLKKNNELIGLAFFFRRKTAIQITDMLKEAELKDKDQDFAASIALRTEALRIKLNTFATPFAA